VAGKFETGVSTQVFAKPEGGGGLHRCLKASDYGQLGSFEVNGKMVGGKWVREMGRSNRKVRKN